MSTLPDDSRKRLQTLEQHRIGSGFQIACVTWTSGVRVTCSVREQSGFMAEIGFEMYQKILDEAIREFKAYRI